MDNPKKQKLLHHIAAGAGFIFLIAWLYMARELRILDWIAYQFPEKYTGAGLMVAVMVVMTPGFYIWTLYNRWVERKLEIKGIYYEDGLYKDKPSKKENTSAESEK